MCGKESVCLCVYVCVVCVCEGKFPSDWLEEKKQLHNLQSFVQNESVGPLIQLIGNFKTATAGHQTKLGPF